MTIDSKVLVDLRAQILAELNDQGDSFWMDECQDANDVADGEIAKVLKAAGYTEEDEVLWEEMLEALSVSWVPGHYE